MPGLAADLAAGVLSGLAFAAPHAAPALGVALVFVHYVTPFPLFFRGFTGGSASVLAAGPAGALTVALAVGPLTVPGLLAALTYLLVLALPALWIALRAESGTATPAAGADRAGRIAAEIAVYAALAYVAVLAWHGFRLEALTGGIREAMQAALGGGDANPRPEAAAVAAAFARFAPGLLAAGWLLLMVGNAVLAQGAAAAAGRARRPTPAWSGLRTPRYLPVLFMAAVLPAALLGEPAGLAFAGLAMILGVPLLCQGLAVVHATSRGLRLRRLALGACYIGMLVWPIAPVAFALLAALGTVDHVGRFRDAPGTA